MEILRRRPARPPAEAAKKPAPHFPAPVLKLPPRIPTDLTELAEATTLLGNLVQQKGKLRALQQMRLMQLLGAIPRVEDATDWKRSLKTLRAERTA